VSDHRPPGERDLGRLLAGLSPRREPGEWVFVVVPEAPITTASSLLRGAAITVREREGVTAVVLAADAAAAGVTASAPHAWITIDVHSALDSVGFIAAISTALTRAGISANVVAGYHHDHLLVPLARADDALVALRRLGARS